MVNRLERMEADERPETSAVGHIEVTLKNAEQLPGLFKLLTLEHARLLEQLLALHVAAQEGEPHEPMLKRTLRAITAHETAETRVLSPRLSEDAKSRRDMENQEDGAEKLRRVAEELTQLAGTPEYARTLEQYVAMFQQLARHAETELYISAQAVLDPTDPVLRQEYERAKAEILSV